MSTSFELLHSFILLIYLFFYYKSGSQKFAEVYPQLLGDTNDPQTDNYSSKYAVNACFFALWEEARVHDENPL